MKPRIKLKPTHEEEKGPLARCYFVTFYQSNCKKIGDTHAKPINYYKMQGLEDTTSYVLQRSPNSFVPEFSSNSKASVHNTQTKVI